MSYEIGIQIEKLARRKTHAPILHLLAGLFLLIKGADYWRYNDFSSWLSVSPFFLIGLISILYGLLHKKLDARHKAQPYIRGLQILCFSVLAFQFITSSHELDGLFSMLWAFICFYFFLMEKRMYDSVKLRIEDGGISLPGMFGRRQLDWVQLENLVVRADFVTIFFTEDRYLQYAVLDNVSEETLVEIGRFIEEKLAARSSVSASD